MKRTTKGRAALAARRKRRSKATGFGLIVVIVLATAGYLLFSAFMPGKPSADGETIAITADMGGFSTQEVHLKVGQPATVLLTSLDTPYHSDGGGKHLWAVDELGVSIIAPAKGSKSATFTPDKPGTYTFYCDICCGGRANPSMQGTLIVEA